MRRRTVSSALAAVLVLLLAAGCVRCPLDVVAQAASPGADYDAAFYRRECGGAIGSFKSGVGLRASAAVEWSEVLTIEEVGYEAHLTWDAPNRLRATVECHRESAEACAPVPKDRWHIETQPRWKNVTIVYELGPQLERWALPEIRAALKN